MKSRRICTKLNWKWWTSRGWGEKLCKFPIPDVNLMLWETFFQFIFAQVAQNRSLEWLANSHISMFHVILCFSRRTILKMEKRPSELRWKLWKIYFLSLLLSFPWTRIVKINSVSPGTTQILQKITEHYFHPLGKYFDRILFALPAWREAYIFRKSRWISHFQLDCQSKHLEIWNKLILTKIVEF